MLNTYILWLLDINIDQTTREFITRTVEL